jgi:hypothetical protein
MAKCFIDASKINQIDTSKLDIFVPNKNLAFALARKDKIDYIYNTSALEGNAMTFPEVQTLTRGRDGRRSQAKRRTANPQPKQKCKSTF